MGRACCVKGCTNRKDTSPHLKFTVFPVIPAVRELWKQAVGRAAANEDGTYNTDKLWSPKGSYYVCSIHFITGNNIYIHR